MKKFLGFWKEFRYYGTSLIEELTNKPHRQEPIYDEAVLNYLEKGIWLARIRTKFLCIFSNDDIGAPSYYTDGIWTWTTEFIYYVNNYGLKIPKEFIEHVEDMNFIIPDKDFIIENELDKIETELDLFKKATWRGN